MPLLFELLMSQVIAIVCTLSESSGYSSPAPETAKALIVVPQPLDAGPATLSPDDKEDSMRTVDIP